MEYLLLIYEEEARFAGLKKSEMTRSWPSITRSARNSRKRFGAAMPCSLLPRRLRCAYETANG
jgi:hypothetical protein